MQYYQAWGLPFFETPLRWRFQKELTGSGALGDLGSHALDLVRFVTGKEYKRLVSHTGTFVHERQKLDGSGMGKVDVDDFSNYMAEMEDGAACTFRITRFGYGRGNYQTMEIYGSEGAIQYELDHVAPDTTKFPSALAVPTQRLMCSQNFPSRKSIRWTRCSLLPTLSTAKGDGMAADIFDGQINQHAVDAVLQSGETGVWVDVK